MCARHEGWPYRKAAMTQDTISPEPEQAPRRDPDVDLSTDKDTDKDTDVAKEAPKKETDPDGTDTDQPAR